MLRASHLVVSRRGNEWGISPIDQLYFIVMFLAGQVCGSRTEYGVLAGDSDPCVHDHSSSNFNFSQNLTRSWKTLFLSRFECMIESNLRYQQLVYSRLLGLRLEWAANLEPWTRRRLSSPASTRAILYVFIHIRRRGSSHDSVKPNVESVSSKGSHFLHLCIRHLGNFDSDVTWR